LLSLWLFRKTLFFKERKRYRQIHESGPMK
jgi:hypothetical protein